MKKKLLVTMLALTLTMTACGSSASNDVAENTEEIAATETEVSTESMSGAAVVAPVVETTEVPSEQETEVVETEIAEETEATEEPAFTVVAMSATKYAKSSVNVRKGPSADYEKIGALSTNQKVKVIGQADTGWYQIELDGEIAYVSNNYLVDEKVAVNPTPSENTGAENTGNVADGSAASGSTSTSTPTPDAGSGDVAEEDEGDLSDWNDFEGGGSFDPVTDGEGPGVEIEITPTP